MPQEQQTELSALRPLRNWEHPANGIWQAEVGHLAAELRYTDLAATAPRIDALNALPKADFPFEEDELTCLVTGDGKIAVRIAAAREEKLYGFGLQLDGLRKSGKVLTLSETITKDDAPAMFGKATLRIMTP